MPQDEAAAKPARPTPPPFPDQREIDMVLTSPELHEALRDCGGPGWALTGSAESWAGTKMPAIGGCALVLLSDPLELPLRGAPVALPWLPADAIQIVKRATGPTITGYLAEQRPGLWVAGAVDQKKRATLGTAEGATPRIASMALLKSLMKQRAATPPPATKPLSSEVP